MARMVPTTDNPNKVDASPTKWFFVDVITKDIRLDDAIQDLVDNCIDGAKRLRGPQGDFSGLSINITINDERFEILDNCGGIPLDVARNHAFKFGRPKGYRPGAGSVGLFGVGMKRALFKLGEQFKVITKEPKSSFEIEVNVADWADDEDNWDFDLNNLTRESNAEIDTGTKIVVYPLEPSVRDTLGASWFINKVGHDIRVAHQDPMRSGLAISLNGRAIISSEWQLKEGEGITPSMTTFEDKFSDNVLLKTRLFSGVGESNRANAGWYIFCNGRCVLEADQTRITGWSDVSENGINLPAYHGQFARFRGYAFLDSDGSSILPWNTMKTGLDPESAAYKRLRTRIIDATRPVIDFLNGLDSEKDLEEDERLLTKAVAKAANVPLARISKPQTFVYTAPPKRGPTLVRISY